MRHDRISPYTTANDDTSVGVAMPNRMPANRITGMRSGRNAPMALVITVRSGARRETWAPARRERSQISIMRQAATTAAGMMPPTNNAAMESVVIEPSTSMAMLGGTVSPMAAEAASTAAPSPTS